MRPCLKQHCETDTQCRVAPSGSVGGVWRRLAVRARRVSVGASAASVGGVVLVLGSGVVRPLAGVRRVGKRGVLCVSAAVSDLRVFLVGLVWVMNREATYNCTSVG